MHEGGAKKRWKHLYRGRKVTVTCSETVPPQVTFWGMMPSFFLIGPFISSLSDWLWRGRMWRRVWRAGGRRKTWRTNECGPLKRNDIYTTNNTDTLLHHIHILVCGYNQVVQYLTNEVLSCWRGEFLIWLLGEDVVEVDSVGVLTENQNKPITTYDPCTHRM